MLQQAAPIPKTEFNRDAHTYEWDDLQVELTDFYRDKKALTVNLELSKWQGDGWETFDHRSFNLVAGDTRDRLVKNLAADKRAPAIKFEDWKERFLYITKKSQQEYQNFGPVAEDINDIEYDRSTSPFLLEPYIASEDITMLFASPAAGKSMMATAMALSLSTGLDFLGITPREQCNVLYLDWEDSRETFRMRCESLMEGFNSRHLENHSFTRSSLFYQRMERSLADQQKKIRDDIRKKNIGCVFIDSLSLAGGDPNEVNNSLAASTIARSLGAPTVFLHHMSKSAANGTDDVTSYGSVFNTAGPRLIWSIAKSQEPGTTESLIQLTNRKANRVALMPPVAYSINYTNDSLGNLSGVYYKGASVRDFMEATKMTDKKMTVQEAIMLVIRDNHDTYMSGKALVNPVSDMLGRDIPEEQIRVELFRGQEKGRFKVHSQKNRVNYWELGEKGQI